MAKNKKARAFVPRPDANVKIEKAVNGYVVSTYTNTGSKTYIEKTAKDAKTRAMKLL